MWAELSRGEGRPAAAADGAAPACGRVLSPCRNARGVAAAADGAAPACGRRSGPNRGKGQEREKPPIHGACRKRQGAGAPCRRRRPRAGLGAGSANLCI